MATARMRSRIIGKVVDVLKYHVMKKHSLLN
jgi:hypothetical protein